jgi:hypothetical protein
MQKMNETEIRRLVAALETTKVLEEEEAWLRLKPLGAGVLPYFLESYPKMKKWRGRVSLVFHSIKYARSHQEAFELGIVALKDKATLVRYRACGLLAYSLRKDAIPYLKELLNHEDRETVEDAKAAIDAIKHQNHHYFMDRTHSGSAFWAVNEEGTA